MQLTYGAMLEAEKANPDITDSTKPDGWLFLIDRALAWKDRDAAYKMDCIGEYVDSYRSHRNKAAR